MLQGQVALLSSICHARSGASRRDDTLAAVPCPDEDSLIGYVDGVVGEDERRELDAHLDACSACQAVAAALVTSTTSVGGGDAPTHPDEVVIAKRYTRRGHLGAGAMGMVIEAWDTVLERAVAVKVLRPEVVSASQQRARILREARALSRLNHPNVVTIYDVGVSEADTVFIVMELVRGGSLRAWLGENHDWREVVRVLVGAGRGLAAAHAAGVIHRDFKPDNVLVGADGRARVTDFGLARDEHVGDLQTLATTKDGAPGREETTRSGLLVGTPAYMAPEQLRGETAEARSDQFGFCVTCYEALLGGRPFAGTSPAGLLDDIARGAIGDPGHRLEGLPEEVVDLLRRGLSLRAADRFASLETLVHRLEKRTRSSARRWSLPVGFGVAALGVAGLSGWDSGPTCTDLDDPLRAVYGASVRDELAAAFADAAVHGDEVWSRLDGRLNDWARTWVETRTEVCRTSDRDATLSAATLDARMSCLDDQLDTLRAFVDAVEAPDEDVVRHALYAVPSAEGIAACRVLTPGESTLSAPRPDQREAVATLRAELSDIRTARRAARNDEAYALAVDVHRRAAATAYAPVAVEALAELGMAAFETSRAAEAEAHLEEASQGAEALGHDQVVAHAQLGLLRVLVNDPARESEVSRVARRAEATIQRLGNPPSMRSRWLASQLFRAAEHARFDEAERYVEELEALVLAHPDLAYARLYTDWADLLRRQGDYVNAAKMLERGLVDQVARLGPHHPDVARTEGTLSITLMALGRTAEGLGRAERALASMTDHFGARSAEVANLHNNLGMAYSRLGRVEEAFSHLHQAVDIKQERFGEGSPNLASSYANLAVVASRRGRPADSDALFLKALGCATPSLGGGHPLVGKLRLSRARVALSEGRVEDAAALAQTVRPDPGAPAAPVLEGERLQFALLLELAQGRPERALSTARTLVEGVERGSPDDVEAKLFADTGLGLALAASDQRREAEAVLGRTLAAWAERPDPPYDHIARMQWAYAGLADDAADPQTACERLAGVDVMLENATYLEYALRPVILRRLGRCPPRKG